MLSTLIGQDLKSTLPHAKDMSLMGRMNFDDSKGCEKKLPLVSVSYIPLFLVPLCSHQSASCHRAFASLFIISDVSRLVLPVEAS